MERNVKSRRLVYIHKNRDGGFWILQFNVLRNLERSKVRNCIGLRYELGKMSGGRVVFLFLKLQ
eukprot:scaffold11976_cov120-Cylindrotheca_fusiformis.AAC.2